MNRRTTVFQPALFAALWRRRHQILVGYVEELEVEPSPIGGTFRILLRHRDQAGHLYTVQVDARRVVSHNVAAHRARDPSRTLFRFPKVELAAFMDGEVLRVCPRDEATRYLTGSPGCEDNAAGDQLV